MKRRRLLALFICLALTFWAMPMSAHAERYEKLVSSDICPKPKDVPLYEYLIRAALFSDNGISTAELCGLLKISGETLRKRLDGVEQRGLLVTNREGNRKYYQIDTAAMDKIMFEK